MYLIITTIIFRLTSLLKVRDWYLLLEMDITTNLFTRVHSSKVKYAAFILFLMVIVLPGSHQIISTLWAYCETIWTFMQYMTHDFTLFIVVIFTARMYGAFKNRKGFARIFLDYLLRWRQHIILLSTILLY